MTVKNLIALPIAISMLAMTTMVRAESIFLETQTGNDIGLSLSSYNYHEPGYMSLQGAKAGLDLHVIRVSKGDDALIFRGDLRLSGGTVDYSSTGTGSASGEPDWYIEARVLVGKDSAINEALISPYTGLGYRYLFNDGRGITSTGYAGYRRESNYIYLPVGIIHRIALKDEARLESTLEYDQLLAGKQVTSLSDLGAGYSDVTNNQSSGYGLKMSVMYQKDKWAIGPYVYYWNIGESDVVYEMQNGSLTGLVEPANNTVEFGLKASQRF